MNMNYSHLVIILDRSGSMQTGQKDMQGGLDTFLADQKKFSSENPDKKCTLSFVQFDGEYELVHDFVDLSTVDKLVLSPRGMTALNDAIGKTINDVGSRLSKMEEKDRPSSVTVLIITDGAENSSKEFSTDQIKKMIQHQESTYNWKFTYLGADHDAFAVSNMLGISKEATSGYAKFKGKNLFSGLSQRVSAIRSVGTNDAFAVYTDEERRDLNG